MSYAAKLREAEQEKRRLRAEYERALVGIPDTQLLQSHDVKLCADYLKEARLLLEKKREAEREISNHPAHAAIERIKGEIASTKERLTTACLESVTDEKATGDALKLKTKLRELQDKLEILTDGITLWIERRRAASPQQSLDEIGTLVRLRDEQYEAVCKLERQKIAVANNPEFAEFAPFNLGR